MKNKKLWLVLVLLVLVIGGSYYGWHATHFAKQTVVQGVQIGKLSYKKADAKISANLKEPTYSLTDPKTKQVLYHGTLKIAASHAYRSELKDLLHQRWLHPFANHAAPAKKARIYDKKTAMASLKKQTDQIDQTIEQLNQSRTAPQNAQITVTDGTASLKKAVAGNQIDTAATTAKLAQQLDPNTTPQQKISVVLKKPAWTGKSAYADLQKKLDQKFKYTVMGKTETTPVKDVLKSGQVTAAGNKFDLTPSLNYIHQINEKYALAGASTANFTTVQGQKVSFENTQGTLGWQLQEYNEGQHLQKELLADKLEITAKNINNTDQKFDKTNLDAVKKVNHIEIDLTNEQLYLVENNKIVQQTPVNTGSPKVNIATPTGYYYIKWRKAPMTMRGTSNDGSKYSSYVPQAMDLTDDGIFIHSAPWVPKTTFGNPKVRYQQGSNGCINVAPAAMEKLFARSPQGMPVIVYGDGLAS